MTKSLKPSFTKAFESGNHQDFLQADEWLQHVHNLSRYGEAIPDAITLNAASSLTLKTDYRGAIVRITSNSDVVLTSNPQIKPGLDGQEVTIEYEGSFSIEFVNSNGVSLSGSNFKMENDDMLILMYNKKKNIWIEKSRSKNA